MAQPVLGLVVGNRGFFPGELCDEGREEVLEALRLEGVRAVTLTPEDTNHGSVETAADAARCARLLREHRDELDGILVTLPNFGDERAVAEVLRTADVGLPVLVHAFPDDPARMMIDRRRDSFCGKISVCNNLRQYGVAFSLTRAHVVSPRSEAFREELRWFVRVCRVVKGMKRVRLGAVGARPAAFNTVRYSERLLEASGVSIETIDLSEVFARAWRLRDTDPEVAAKLEALAGYAGAASVPAEALTRMARLGVVLDRWVRDNGLAGAAVQCWTAVEEVFGAAPCAVMSMMSQSLIPCACEVDVQGLVAMYALQQASGRPSALLDWNNNYGDEPDKCVLFHCSNLPRDFLSAPKLDYQAIIAATVGRENAYGTVVGRIAPGPFTFAGLMTDDAEGGIRVYVGEGRFTEDPLESFGGYGVAYIPELASLMRYICDNGFEHHVAANRSQTASVLAEALGNYMGWEVYVHSGSGRA